MPALIPPVLKMKLTPIRAGVKRATKFSKSGVKRVAFFGPIFTFLWPCYGFWSLNVAKNMAVQISPRIYLIGPFSASPFLTLAPLTPVLIPPVLKMRLMPIRAGVKRATNFSKSGVKRAAFFGRPM